MPKKGDGRYRNIEKMPDTSADNWYVSEWKPFHSTIAQLAASGKKTKEIAEAIDYHPNHVSKILQTPLMKAEIQRLRGNYENLLIEADLRLRSLAHRAIDVLEENLGEPKQGVDPLLKDRAELTKDAKYVLDLAMRAKGGGNGGVQVNNVMNVQQVLNDAKAKSDSDLIKDVTTKIRESRSVQ